MDHAIIQFLHSKFPFLEEEDIVEFLKISTVARLKTGELFVRENDLEPKVGIIIHGLLRGYILKEDGTELTMMFRSEWEIVAAFEPVILQNPSKQIFEVLEDASLVVFPFYEFERLCKENPRINDAFHKEVLKLLANSLQIIQSYMNEKPESRYLKLIEKNSQLLNRITQKQLASFLGITPVSLSRMRGRLAKR